MLKRSTSYTIMVPDKLADKQAALIKQVPYYFNLRVSCCFRSVVDFGCAQVAEVLYVEPPEAGVLLRHFGYQWRVLDY